MSAEEGETKPAETKEEKAPEESAPEGAESTATFEPVVRLEEVEVKSGEEEEEVIFEKRAKLFIFGETLLDKGTGNKTWRERGIGEMRILRHKEHKKTRVLMRQEKTMKVICNHVIDPRIELRPNVGNDRSWVWRAFDFAEGTLEETMFAVRFGDSDIANEFKTEFEKCQKEMEELVGSLDQPTEDAEATAAADDAADALAGLSTKDANGDTKEGEKKEEEEKS